ncbi:methyltransferase domain-containing protein [Pedobacter sp. MC2016-24]|uniref:methyltransferase domain-containing protein n=1 Tax=Pedobacter sp. MC2016-24 TaxID=2780090 RepID=UPI0018814AA2|nr:methyltransferase domain-containing protein [Pedobacter sp. MC2016-24]MBE9598799.1 methyltransferase domain-containing protein [Pedobacter sp. MC2016-24]
MNFFYDLGFNKVEWRTKILLLLFNKTYKKKLIEYKYAFADKIGLEIGGPSKFFSSEILPIYNWVERIDGCNFSKNTIWEGAIDGDQYKFHPDKSGKQYILDGSDLVEIEDKKYDFLLSCHNLEHIANPLKAIKEWVRVLKPGGFMLLILPDKRFTFDRNRPYTSFDHILSDFESNMGEDDLTHLEEILRLHDLIMDPGAGMDFEVFKERCEDNFAVRGLHQHVFSFDLLEEISSYFNLSTVLKYDVPPYHKIILARKKV